MNRVNQRRFANIGDTNHHHKQSRLPSNHFLKLKLHEIKKLYKHKRSHFKKRNNNTDYDHI